MNKQATISRVYSKFVFVLFASLLMAGFTASAQTDAPEKATDEITIRHQGYMGNKEYFSVKVPNEAGEKFSIKVKDTDGALIFSDVFMVKDFERSFQFEKLADKSKLTFIIRTLKDNKEQVFEVNSKVFTVEQVEISRAK